VFSADFAYAQAATSGTGLLGVHGRSSEPAVEYFIIEDWWGTRPTFDVSRGTIRADGGTYDACADVISGTTIIRIFASVRTAGRACGHTSTPHFAAGAGMDTPMGMLQEVTLFVEGLHADGDVELTKGTLTVE